MNTDQKRKRSGRKRRAAGWTFLALGLLAAAGWVVLRWWKLVIFSDGMGVVLDCGALDVSCSEAYGQDTTFLWARTHAPQWDLWAGVAFERTYDQRTLGAGVFYYSSIPAINSWMMHVILWPVPLLLWAAGVPLLSSGILAGRRRRTLTGKCKKCGYDLAGLAPDAPCPECGKGAVTT